MMLLNTELVILVLLILWGGKLTNKLGKKLLTIVMLCLVVISIGLGVFTASDKEVEFLATHTKAICKNDLHTFQSDTCLECSNSIQETGVFKNIEDAGKVGDKVIKFTDKYKDFSEYKRVLNQSRILTGSFMFVLTFSIYFIIIKILRTLNKGK